MDELILKLADSTLAGLPAAIRKPHYDRARLTPGILHIGLGNFHRAHQSWYLHRLMQQGEAMDWAIIGAGVRPEDAQKRLLLAAQDYLTTLIELGPDGRTAEITGSMIGYVPVEADNAALIDAMANPAIRIVSLTVTEGGYYTNPATGDFDDTHPDIRHDAANPGSPRTAFGAMLAALKKRRDSAAGPFTGMSCDNMQGNGKILRRALVSLAGMSDPGLARWIDGNCTFPDSMVDCIVPATGDKERALVRQLGIDDALPVTHENFRQWVIEDDFCAGRPGWEKTGATFTDNVHDYEVMKIRILNGGHQLIAAAGEVLSLEFIADCMQHELIGGFFRKVAITEIAPHVRAVPGMTPQQYIKLIDRRFSNPGIGDTVRRVAFDGSSRQPGFILPTLREAIAKGAPHDGLVLSQAIWARMCEGLREDGSVIEANDPHWQELTATAQAAGTDPQKWLDRKNIYGELRDNPAITERFRHWHAMIQRAGLAAALRAYKEG